MSYLGLPYFLVSIYLNYQYYCSSYFRKITPDLFSVENNTVYLQGTAISVGTYRCGQNAQYPEQEPPYTLGVFHPSLNHYSFI